MTRFAKKDAYIIKTIDYFMKMKRFAKKDAFIVKPRLHSSINLVNHIKSRPFCLSPFGKCLSNKAYNVYLEVSLICFTKCQKVGSDWKALNLNFNKLYENSEIKD